MNMIRALANAFGVDPAVLERLVEAYENPDRLALVEARWQEAGCGDADKRWLIDEVKRLRKVVVALACPYEALLLDEKSRRWLAPTLWAAIEEGVAAARDATAMIGVNP